VTSIALLSSFVVILDDCGRVPYVEQPDAPFGAVRTVPDRFPPTRA
jgi:hypothetical protein